MDVAAYQDAFAAALLANGAVASPSPMVERLRRQPGFAVYRNTVMKGCIDALALRDVPVVAAGRAAHQQLAASAPDDHTAAEFARHAASLLLRQRRSRPEASARSPDRSANGRVRPGSYSYASNLTVPRKRFLCIQRVQESTRCDA